jgi:predicted transposase YbfD/YdcC
LAIGVCAVLAGARSFTAIGEWAQDLTPAVRVRLGLGRRPPSESTIRRALQRVDAAAFDRVLSDWLATRVTAAEPLRVIALDGKSARGARSGDERAVHLLAAFDAATGVVLGQARVDGKTNEITAFAPLLDHIDITGAIVTADALHTQRAHADYLIGRGAHYLLTVKGNQARLLAQLRALPWADVPVADQTTGKGHGRVESRTLKMTGIDAGIGFPHAHLAIQITRRRRPRAHRKWRTEKVYAITDLTYREVDAAQLADALRAHWGIENRLHWIRDVVFAEDFSQIRTGNAPAVMATLRNLAISVHRLNGALNIAAACRHVSRHPNRVLQLLR